MTLLFFYDAIALACLGVTMHVHCSCQTCQAQFKVAEEHTGRRARCPKCGSALDVPPIEPPEVEPLVVESRAEPPVVASEDIPVAIPVIGPDSSSASRPPICEFPASQIAASQVPVAMITEPTGATVRMRRLHRRSVSTKALLILSGIGLLLAAVTYGGYSLYSKHQSRPGWLVLDGDATNLNDVLVSVDGERLGTLGGKQTDFPVSASDHVLILKRRGYLPIEKSFSVERGKQWHFNPVWIQPEGFPAEPAVIESIPSETPKNTVTNDTAAETRAE